MQPCNIRTSSQYEVAIVAVAVYVHFRTARLHHARQPRLNHFSYPVRYFRDVGTL